MMANEQTAASHTHEHDHDHGAELLRAEIQYGGYYRPRGHHGENERISWHDLHIRGSAAVPARREANSR